MKLTIKERLELKKIMKGFFSDKTEEIEILQNIFNKTDFTISEKQKLDIQETVQGYKIGFEQDCEFEFEKDELKLLKKLHGLIESNSRVCLDNLSLCQKIRDVQVDNC